MTIFEKTNKVGGVWSANYADFGLQVPKELYEFPDFPCTRREGLDPRLAAHRLTAACTRTPVSSHPRRPERHRLAGLPAGATGTASSAALISAVGRGHMPTLE